MSRTNLEARIRQVLANDTNAADIYADLAALADDGAMKAQFEKIAEDERRHVEMSKELLSLLGKPHTA
jgi:rubrerythrin